MMNRVIYLAPLASFPLMALAQQAADDTMKAENPYVTAAMIFLAALAVPAALIAYFRLQHRGRVVSAVAFGAMDWLVTVPLVRTSGVGLYASLAIATVSSAAVAFVIVRYGANLSSFFRGRDAVRTDADRE